MVTQNTIRHKGLLGGNLRAKPTFLLNFRFPWGLLILYFEIPTAYASILETHHHCQSSTTSSSSSSSSSTTNNNNLKSSSAYYSPLNNPNTTPQDRVLYRFLINDTNHKNQTLKLIPKVQQGNLLVRNAVKGKPVIIGKRLPITYTFTPTNALTGESSYLEADLDLGSSKPTAQRIVGICKKYIKTMTVDLGLVIEGTTEEELPECMLASVGLHKLDPTKCAILEPEWDWEVSEDCGTLTLVVWGETRYREFMLWSILEVPSLFRVKFLIPYFVQVRKLQYNLVADCSFF